MNTKTDPGLPKYAQVAERLRSDIRTGVLTPGSRLPSYTQVRQRYGASKQTLERAHTLLEQEGLILRRNGIGTLVAEARQRVGTGVIAIEQSFPSRHPYTLRLLQGVQETAHDRHFEVLLVHAGSRIGWEKIDGLLSCAGDFGIYLPKWSPGMPYMGLLMPVSGMPHVVADDYHGMRESVRHLVDLGHRRIAYMTGDGGEVNGLLKIRWDAYDAGLRECGIQRQESWVRPFYYRGKKQLADKVEQSRLQMEQWIADGWAETGCSAILAQNDEVAMGLIDALHAAGYRVPQDVSVVGFDGLDLVHPSCGPLTTVKVPLYDIGAEGTRRLIQTIECSEPSKPYSSPGGESPTVLPVEFVVGSSTAEFRG